MKRAAKVDANQAEIVSACRDFGASVACLHTVGKGVPDLLIGIDGINLLFEVKDGGKPISQRRLTIDQVSWHANWCGTVYVVESVERALEILTHAKERLLRGLCLVTREV